MVLVWGSEMRGCRRSSVVEWVWWERCAVEETWDEGEDILGKEQAASTL